MKNQQAILSEIENLGNEVKVCADPQHYSYEQRHYAHKFQMGLPSLRRAYAFARQGDESSTRESLRQAREIIGGIEGNFIGRVLHWIDGGCDKPECYWCRRLEEVKEEIK